MCIVLARAGVEWWRWNWQNAVVLPGLGAGEQICHEARHGGMDAFGRRDSDGIVENVL